MCSGPRLTLRFGSHHFRARAAVLNWGPALLFIDGNNSPVARKKSALSFIKSMPVLGRLSYSRGGAPLSLPIARAAICDLLERNFASLPSARSALLIFGAYPADRTACSQRGIVRLIVRLMGRLVRR
jgi:hypothetical protein